MHHKNRIISILFMGSFLALSLAACEDQKPPYPDNGETTTTTGTTSTTGTTGTTSTTATTSTTTTSSTTTMTIIVPDSWSFTGDNDVTRWAVRKNGAAPSRQTAVTVRVGDTIEWKVEARQHGLVFSTEAAAKGMLTFLPGGQTLQNSPGCFPPNFTWGTNKCFVGFPAGTVLARAKVKATGSLPFTCEVHGPDDMRVTLTASP